MSDAADQFRARLSEKLRVALTDRDRETIRSLRSIMSALDNATAVSQEEGAISSATEVPRRTLSEREIAEILQAEIDSRSEAADQYERIGNSAQAVQLRDDIATIEQLAMLLR